jgi:uncharacterized protein YkwD
MALKPTAAVTAAVTVILAFAVVAPPASGKSCQGAGVPAAELTPQQAKGAAVCLMNQRRAKHGVRKLRFNGALAAAAQSHSAEMDALDFFSHDSPTGSSPLSRIRGTGYIAGASAWGIGENIGWASGALASPKGIVSMWMKSPGHRRIILSREFKHVGIGVVIGSPDGDSTDGAIYTADFGYRR